MRRHLAAARGGVVPRDLDSEGNIFENRSAELMMGGQPQSMIRPSSEYDLVHLTTSNGDAIVALFGSALDADGHVLQDAASRPTLLYFYGNAMTLADCFNEFRGFRRLGLNVMIPEYPGYGMSSGRASEHSFYACAGAAYDYLCHRVDVDSTQFIDGCRATTPRKRGR